MSDALAIIVPTRDGYPHAVLLSQAYRRLSLRPRYFVDSRSSWFYRHVASRLLAAPSLLPCDGDGDFIEAILPKIVTRLRSQWIFRFDDDEFPSPKLIEWLRTAPQATGKRILAVPRQAVRIRDGVVVSAGALPQIPEGDYQFRGFRPEQIAFDDTLHTSGLAFDMSEVLFAPLDCVIYHFDWIVRSRAEREAKLHRYEAIKPGCWASYRYQYLPEDFDAAPYRYQPSQDAWLVALARSLERAATRHRSYRRWRDGLGRALSLPAWVGAAWIGAAWSGAGLAGVAPGATRRLWPAQSPGSARSSGLASPPGRQKLPGFQTLPGFQKLPGLQKLLGLQKPYGSPKPLGLFITHVVTPRITRHFERLSRQSRHFVDWRLLHNPWTPAQFLQGHGGVSLAPHDGRASRAVANGSFRGGYLDVVFMAHALAASHERVWVMEYDVDFSGHWGKFFGQFQDNPADLLTTTLNTAARDPDWCFWASARYPPGLPADLLTRAFLPICRLSRGMIETYAASIATEQWDGHYEFLLPTMARAQGLSVEDLGGCGPFAPQERRGINYINTPNDPYLSPGSFVWRPSRPRYFHEDPGQFWRPDTLFHPVKPDLEDWEARLPEQ